MRKYYRTRTTYAPGHRVSAPRSQGGIYYTEAGEGLLRQTCSGQQQGFTAPIVTRQRGNGATIYFVESDTFADRYFGLYQQNGAWVLVGESDNSIDRAHKKQCVIKIEAFLAEQCEAVVA